MPLYDYTCPKCGIREQFSLIAHRNDQRCEECGSSLTLIPHPPPKKNPYKPFNPYFDEQLGVMITGRDHRRRVMRDQKCDFRDHPSEGQLSARRDWANEIRKDRQR